MGRATNASRGRRLLALESDHGLEREQAEAVLDVLEAHEAIVAREAELERAELTRDAIDEGVPIATLARAAGVTRATVYRWENDYGN